MHTQSPVGIPDKWTIRTRDDGGFWSEPVIGKNKASAYEFAAEESAICDEVMLTDPHGNDVDVWVCITREGVRYGHESEEAASKQKAALNEKWGKYGLAKVVKI